MNEISNRARPGRGIGRMLAALLFAGSVAACSTLGASGPSGGSIRGADDESYADSGIHILELNGGVLGSLNSYSKSTEFAEIFDAGHSNDLVIGRGDVLDIAIWEAPPAVLFGAAVPGGAVQAAPQVAQSTTIPQQRIGEEGTVTVPFVGQVPVIGLSPSQVERAIVERLQNKAHDPQVVVRLVQNEAQNVTVIGEVGASRRMPLTARGERLLDAIAKAGGTKHPVDKSTVQLARGTTTAAMPLQRIVSDPDQNVPLRPDDVVTVLHQPFSFIALGAVRNSAEVPFEGSGLKLSQALGRVGGLNDRRADIKGVFVFRMEDPRALGGIIPEDAQTTSEGLVPVIYRLKMSDPVSLFAMQDFPMRDQDVLYVSTAPGADLQRFISTLSSTAFSFIAISDALQTNGN